MNLDVPVQHPPLLADAYDLALEMTRRLDETPSTLGRRIHRLSLELLDAVWLALHDRAPERLDEVDERLMSLRLALRLRIDLDGDDAAAMLSTLELVTSIGRQLGGWKKASRSGT